MADKTTIHLTSPAKDAGLVIGNKLSVIIITKNEAHNIRSCLESVIWADEIVVVDSGSSDGTAEICRGLGAKIYVHDWPGYGAQKNRALNYAGNDWVLSLDADERVTPELHGQLVHAMKDTNKDGYYLPRLSQFCGQFVHHSGWYPDFVLRLFKRGKGRFSDDIVHETVILQGHTGKLSSPLLHYSYLTSADVERKVEQYSTAAARQMFGRGKTTTRYDAPVRAAWAFFRTYCLRLGVLDGKAGFNIARMNARTTYLKYKKLEALQSA
jgi:glycosyltransferase involved in cell wall biosynthesis